jgi:hypothetical protein
MKTFIVGSLLFALVFAVEQPRLRANGPPIPPNVPPIPLFQATVEGRYGLANSVGPGSVYWIYCSPAGRPSPHLGPILVWANGSVGPYVQLDDALSSLDMMCNAEVEAIKKYDGPKATSEPSLRSIIGQAIGFYSKDAIDIGSELGREYIEALKKHVSDEDFRQFAALMPAAKVSFTPTNWTISITLVTRNRSIERRTYSGGLNPVAFKKMEVEVLAPADTMPQFQFVPCAD